jgi:hypothetical protein
LRHEQTGKRHPWMTHHADAYPLEAQRRIKVLMAELLAECEELEARLASDNSSHRSS